VRRIIHQAQVGLLLEMGDEDLWRCTSCGACVEQCPRGVDVVPEFFGGSPDRCSVWGISQNLSPS